MQPPKVNKTIDGNKSMKTAESSNNNKSHLQTPSTGPVLRKSPRKEEPVKKEEKDAVKPWKMKRPSGEKKEVTI